MLGSLLAAFLLVQSTTASVSQDDVKDALAHAEALYFEAQFKDSIQLLTRVDDILRRSPDRLQDKLNTKLQLALANVGLNDFDQAKSFLRELYALDADYSLDAQQFSPKIIALADHAKAEENEIRCHHVREEARQQLGDGNVPALLAIIGAMRSACPDIAALEPDAAELLYKTGLDSYKRGDYPGALPRFQEAVRLSPRHELAQQYIDLTRNRLEVSEDRLLLDWQKHFAAREWAQAATEYRRLSPQGLKQAETQYRRELTALVESWNQACAKGGDPATMTAIGNQVSDLLPEPSFGQDIRSQMTNCTKLGCVEVTSHLAMTRLKSRVDPELSATVRSFLRSSSQNIVRVKMRIDEGGNVTVSEAQGANILLNNLVLKAVERWKFAPAVDDKGPRCVLTEIPISIEP